MNIKSQKIKRKVLKKLKLKDEKPKKEDRDDEEVENEEKESELDSDEEVINNKLIFFCYNKIIKDCLQTESFNWHLRANSSNRV